MARSSLSVLVAAITAMSCTSAGQPIAQSSPSALPCDLSTLQLGPTDRPYGLAHAGPLWFSAFGRVNPGTPAALEPGGGPYDGWKVAIVPEPAATGSAKLTGSECGSGKAVRFCYGACDYATRLTSSVLTLDVDVSKHLDDTGYMVFPGPGLMRLSVLDSHGSQYSVVIKVPEAQSQ